MAHHTTFACTSWNKNHFNEDESMGKPEFSFSVDKVSSTQCTYCHRSSCTGMCDLKFEPDNVSVLASAKWKRRVPLLPWQRKELVRAFEASNYISGEKRKQLSRQLSLPEAKVQVWFQNRRARSKQLNKPVRQFPYIPLRPPSHIFVDREGLVFHRRGSSADRHFYMMRSHMEREPTACCCSCVPTNVNYPRGRFIPAYYDKEKN